MREKEVELAVKIDNVKEDHHPLNKEVEEMDKKVILNTIITIMNATHLSLTLIHTATIGKTSQGLKMIRATEIKGITRKEIKTPQLLLLFNKLKPNLGVMLGLENFG